MPHGIGRLPERSRQRTNRPVAENLTKIRKGIAASFPPSGYRRLSNPMSPWEHLLFEIIGRLVVASTITVAVIAGLTVWTIGRTVLEDPPT